MHPTFAILTAIVLAVPVAAGGQVSVRTTPVLSPGDTLRIWATGPRLEKAVAALTRLDVREMTVADVAASTPQTIIPLNALTRLEVQRGKHRSTPRMITGMAIGAAAGVLAGMALGSAFTDCNSCSGDQDPTRIFGYVVTVGVSAIGGAVAGGFIGAKRRPHWITVSFR
jgi:uncharacterized protein YcfJ